jgi:hypothetical protein
MSIYLNAVLMLFVTLAAFVALAVGWRFVRNGALRSLPAVLGRSRPIARRLRIEEVHQLDGKRRLVLVACDGQRVLLLTGGPLDLVVSRFEGEPHDGDAGVPA